MNLIRTDACHSDFLKGNEFAPTNLGNPSPAAGEMVNPAPSNVSARHQEREPLSKEREEELENWMTEVRSFIRSIDIDNL